MLRVPAADHRERHLARAGRFRHADATSRCWRVTRRTRPPRDARIPCRPVRAAPGNDLAPDRLQGPERRRPRLEATVVAAMTLRTVLGVPRRSIVRRGDADTRRVCLSSGGVELRVRDRLRRHLRLSGFGRATLGAHAADLIASRRGGRGCVSFPSRAMASNGARCCTVSLRHPFRIGCGSTSSWTSVSPNGASPHRSMATWKAPRRSVLTATATEARAHATWSIEMMQRPMRLAARIALPLLRWGHDRVVEATVDGFRGHLVDAD